MWSLTSFSQNDEPSLVKCFDSKLAASCNKAKLKLHLPAYLPGSPLRDAYPAESLSSCLENKYLTSPHAEANYTYRIKNLLLMIFTVSNPPNAILAAPIP